MGCSIQVVLLGRGKFPQNTPLSCIVIRLSRVCFSLMSWKLISKVFLFS